VRSKKTHIEESRCSLILLLVNISECSETYNLLHGACGCDNNKQAIFVPFNGLDQMLNQMGSAYYSNMFV
jgi:hypothetical protein